MSDYLVSQVRTWVPVGVGAVLAWLATLGLDLDATTSTGLITALTAAVTGLYYSAVRLAERRWPWVGLLLGTRNEPTYGKPRTDVVNLDVKATSPTFKFDPPKDI